MKISDYLINSFIAKEFGKDHLLTIKQKKDALITIKISELLDSFLKHFNEAEIKSELSSFAEFWGHEDENFWNEYDNSK